MAAVRQAFEKDLKTKLSQKSSSHTTDETVLLKAFKYFDLDNSGTVSTSEWIKALEKIGINSCSTSQLLDLFNIYDADGSGSLEYHEFGAGIFGGNSAAGRTASGRNTIVDWSKAEEALVLFREKLNSRGARGIIGLARQFRIMDDDDSRSIDFYEFSKAVRDYRVQINDGQLQHIFTAIDRDQSGVIDYDEFLRAVRGSMNNFRKTLVEQAFNKLDADRSGILDISDVKKFYDASRHPDVKAGRRTEDDILDEFLETFEMQHALNGTVDHKVTKEEFIEYYTNVSASIDNDSYFELMMNNAWKLTEAPAYTKRAAWSNTQEETPQPQAMSIQKRPQRQAVRSAAPPRQAASSAAPSRQGVPSQVRPVSKEAGDALLDKFRSALSGRGARGIIGLGRQFRIMDDNGSMTLDAAEFHKAIADYRVNVGDEEIDTLFRAFDRDGKGEIDYDEFLRGVAGPMNAFRSALVTQAFKKLDRDSSGIVDINDIRDVYSAKNHPDVRAGKKTEDEVLDEFLETFELHHNISDKSLNDHRITMEEFVEYYNNVSASITEDVYFETMITNAWKLKGNAATRDAWAGQIGGRDFNPNHKAQWLIDHHRAQFTGSVSASAPFGTSQDPVRYQTALRPGNDDVDLLQLAATQKSAGNPSWPVGGPSQSTAMTPDDMLNNFRQRLIARGARGIIGLSRQFRIMDDSGNQMLEFSEFVKALGDYRIDIPASQVRELFGLFDRDGSGSIDYDEFLRVIRGPMSESRLNLVGQAFDKIDKTGDGVLALEDIKGVYNARNHPDVRMGKKTEDEVLESFLNTFESHHSIMKGGVGLDNRVSKEEFIEYYTNVSASIDDDRYFELMITNAWNFEGRSYEKAWAQDQTSPPQRRKYF